MSEDNDIEMMTKDVSEEVRNVVRQAQEIRSHKGTLWETHFYKIVLGGSVTLIKNVVHYMEQNDMKVDLDWLLQKDQHDCPKFQGLHDKSLKVKLRKISVFVVLTLLNVLLTPVFYVLHILSVSWLNRKQKQISANIQLPLAFAVFSQNPDMVSYFLSLDIDIDDTDQNGSNVFHYIADMSAENPESGVDMFKMTSGLVHDPVLLRTLLMEQRNSSGMTPVEYTAKCGSPVLLTRMLRSQETLPLGGDKPEKRCSKLELVDVSLYESGSTTEMSKLLNLLSDRDIMCMGKDELGVFCKKQLLGKWAWLKTKQMMSGVLLFQMFDVIITFLMIFLLSSSYIGTFGRNYRQWQSQQLGDIQLSEVSAWNENKSFLFKDSTFHRVINRLRYEKQAKVLKKLCEDNMENVVGLVNSTAQHAQSLTRFMDKPSGNWNISVDDLSPTEMDELYDEAIGLEEFRDARTALYLYRHFLQFLKSFGHELLHSRHDIFPDEVDFGNPMSRQFYKMFHFEVDGYVIKPSLVLSFDEFRNNYICVKNANFTYSDLRELDHVELSPEFHNKTVDSCFHRLVVRVGNKKGGCIDTSSHIMTETLHSANNEESLHSEKWWCPKILILCTVCYLLLDMLERCVFVSTCIRYHTSTSAMFFTFFSQKVPGSYARKQLNMFSYLSIIREQLSGIYISKDLTGLEAIDEYLDRVSVGMIIFILGIVIRFVMHIHSLRLLPGIGNFIITTFSMATNLLHFSTVFGCVLLIFSVLFHILIDHPACPIEKAPGFTTLPGSMLSTFQLTFGHGDIEPFVTDTTVQLIYVMYVIIMGLLLLNLIIAIMSTTAMDVMAEPWKSTLWKIEWLDEATSVEYAFAVLGLPFRRISRLGVYTHRHAGFVVKEIPGKKYRVYVELFDVNKVKINNNN